MKSFFALGALAAGLLAGWASGAAPASGDQLVDLKFKFLPGSRFSYAVRVVKTSEVQSATTVKIVDDNAVSSTFVVQAKESGNTNLRFTYDRLAVKRDIGSQKQVYDSQDAATYASPLAASVAGMVGASLTVALTSGGEILGIQGIETLNQRMLASGVSPAANQPVAPGQSENTIKSSLNQFFNFYPGHPLKPGESWIKNVVLNLDTDTMKLASTYTLSGVQNGVAHLLTTGKLTSSGTGTYTGTQNGTLDVDVATGLVLRSQLRRTMAGRTGKFPIRSVTDVTVAGKKL